MSAGSGVSVGSQGTCPRTKSTHSQELAYVQETTDRVRVSPIPQGSRCELLQTTHRFSGRWPTRYPQYRSIVKLKDPVAAAAFQGCAALAPQSEWHQGCPSYGTLNSCKSPRMNKTSSSQQCHLAAVAASMDVLSECRNIQRR